MGGVFAGCDESPGYIELFQGRKYKAIRGVTPIKDIDTTERKFFVKKDTQSPVSESVEGRVSYKGSIKDIIKDLLGGIELGMQYAGTPTIDELKENAEFVLITESSRQESHPHNVLITKESSNYTIQI